MFCKHILEKKKYLLFPTGYLFLTFGNSNPYFTELLLNSDVSDLETHLNEHNEQVECTDLDRHRKYGNIF